MIVFKLGHYRKPRVPKYKLLGNLGTPWDKLYANAGRDTSKVQFRKHWRLPIRGRTHAEVESLLAKTSGNSDAMTLENTHKLLTLQTFSLPRSRRSRIRERVMDGVHSNLASKFALKKIGLKPNSEAGRDVVQIMHDYTKKIRALEHQMYRRKRPVSALERRELTDRILTLRRACNEHITERIAGPKGANLDPKEVKDFFSDRTMRLGSLTKFNQTLLEKEEIRAQLIRAHNRIETRLRGVPAKEKLLKEGRSLTRANERIAVDYALGKSGFNPRDRLPRTVRNLMQKRMDAMQTQIFLRHYLESNKGKLSKVELTRLEKRNKALSDKISGLWEDCQMLVNYQVKNPEAFKKFSAERNKYLTIITGLNQELHPLTVFPLSDYPPHIF